MSLPLVSIIIPTFNRAHLIGQTIESILNQTYTNWECVIIDDGSTDGTRVVIESYSARNPKIKYFVRPQDLIKGANSCRNYGFEKSNGDWIKWFDSDDLFFENALEKTIPFLNDENDVVISKLLFVDENIKPINRKHTILSENVIDDYLVGNIAFYTIGPTWKRSFLEGKSELFDVTIGNLDDWDFNLRMIYENPKMTFINEALIQYRVHSNSLSHELDKLNLNEIKSEFKAREKHLEILKKKNNPAKKVLQNYIKIRSKYFFRNAVINNDQSKHFFLKKVLFCQVKSFDLIGFLKTLFGFVFFTIFKKGYKLLK